MLLTGEKKKKKMDVPKDTKIHSISTPTEDTYKTALRLLAAK